MVKDKKKLEVSSEAHRYTSTHEQHVILINIKVQVRELRGKMINNSLRAHYSTY
jgi:hypothetical protein